MRTAIYITDGVTQLVLTPETETGKAVLNTLQGHGETDAQFSAYRGSFYECAGGWTRQGTTENSLIIRATRTTQVEP